MGSAICIRALGDNLIYLYPYGEGLATVIDPGNAGSVLRKAKELGLRITLVLATHHHFDHVGGIEEIKRRTGCQVIAAGTAIAGVDRRVGDGDVAGNGLRQGAPRRR